MRSHDSKSQVDNTLVLPQQPTGNSCQFCAKVSDSAAGQRSYARGSEVNVNTKDISFACHMGDWAYKNEFQQRSHKCANNDLS